MDASSCWGCGKALDPQDRYCRHCGRGQGAFAPWYYRPWGILLCTVLGLGPFGLVLVWRSPRLDARGRWVWGSAVLLVSAYFAWSCYKTWVLVRSLLPDVTQLGTALPY